MTADHTALLEKYIRHVCQCSGTDFVDHIDDGWGSSEVKFTEAEKMALRAASVRISSNPWAKNPADVMAALDPTADSDRIGAMRDFLAAPVAKPKTSD